MIVLAVFTAGLSAETASEIKAIINTKIKSSLVRFRELFYIDNNSIICYD